tara:strand:+ start:1508 stop:2386 length:879 start_codon:yes stop_codon:yes gene_type:complete
MKNISLIVLMLLSLSCISQSITHDYINKYKDIAIEEMNIYKIPASITLSQGILESSNGESFIAKNANNHFGIKCHSSWKGEKIYYDDDIDDECFRKYDDYKDSYRDHSLFLANSERYSSLFKLPIKSYKSWAKGLKRAGYATNPKYAALLIDIIKRYNLNDLDKLENDAKRFYISNSYGFPYLYGVGINYLGDRFICNVNLYSSFIYLNKSSFGFDYLLKNNFYLGGNIGIVYVKDDMRNNLGVQISYKNELSTSKKNNYVIISLGTDMIFNDFNNFDKKNTIPYFSLSYLF